MWDLHHCLNATRRGAEVAPRMNKLLIALRDRGVTIIHAPSNCMEFYKDHPARQGELAVPTANNLPEEIGKWCYQIPAAKSRASTRSTSRDGGEDDDPARARRVGRRSWPRWDANPSIPGSARPTRSRSRDGDFISDNGDEIWSILESRGIDNVMLVGVHTNMCVLGRPFGLRQMAKNGKNVVLIRDMTDTMYNPEQAPYVSHFTGTDLIVEHIEKYVCPTITSDQLLGRQAVPLRQRHAGRGWWCSRPRTSTAPNRRCRSSPSSNSASTFRIECVFGNAEDRNDLPGIEVLKDADVLILSARRRVLPKAQMEIVRGFIESGKPVVAVRTASHAFCAAESRAAGGLSRLAGTRSRHSRRQLHEPSRQRPEDRGERRRRERQKHPILAGVEVAKLVGNGSLYKVSPLTETTTPILIGEIPDKPAEPIAWTNAPKTGGRVFYTSLAHPDDFNEPEFNRLLRNAVYWAAGIKPADKVEYGY